MKKIATYSLLSTAIMASTAMAHTTIQSTISADNTGTTSTSYNNIVIGHGCTDAKDKTFPVKAQSVLFPTVNPDVYVDSSTTPSDLAVTDLIGPAPTNSNPNPVSLGLANIPQLIQSKDVFGKQSEKTNSAGNVIGFNASNGALDTSLYGLVPFRFNAIKFKTGVTGLTNGCIKKLVVKVAIADICKMSFPKGGPIEGQANLWMPNTTATKFTHALDGTSATPLAGSPASLTINNDTACGSGSTVTIWPSNEDIEQNLVMPKWGK